MNNNKTIIYIKNVYFKIKNNPLLGLFILVFLIVLFVFSFSTSNKRTTTSSDTQTSKPSNTPKLIRQNEPFNQNNPSDLGEKEFIFNSFNTEGEVLSYKWIDKNKIIYTTKYGLFDLWENKVIFKSNIKDSIFSRRGNNLIYKDDQGIFVYNIVNNSNEKISVNWNHLYINDFGNYLIYKDIDNYKIFDITTKTSKTINVNLISKINWVDNQNKFYIFNENESNVDIYDINLQKLSSFRTEDRINFISVNLVTHQYIFSKDNYIHIQNFESNEKIQTTAPENENFQVYWLDDKNILLIEKVYRGIYDLYDQNIWIINSKNEKIYIGNSVFIINKINTKNNFVINDEGTAILFSENKKNLWIISLKQNFLPVYDSSGLNFYKYNANPIKDAP